MVIVAASEVNLQHILIEYQKKLGRKRSKQKIKFKTKYIRKAPDQTSDKYQQNQGRRNMVSKKKQPTSIKDDRIAQEV